MASFSKKFLENLIIHLPILGVKSNEVVGTEESTTVDAPLILDGYNIIMPPASLTQDGYLTSADYTRFDARSRAIRTWQYQDFVGPITGPLTLSAFDNGTLPFDSSLIIDGTATIVLESDNEKPPTTTLSIPGRWLSSNRVSVSSHVSTSITLNQDPAASLTCRVYYIINHPASQALADDYLEAPKFIREQRIQFLDDAFVNQEGDETISGIKTFSGTIISDGYFQHTEGATDGYVFTSDPTGVASWQPALGGVDNLTGPVSTTDNAITRWDGISGTVVQNSGNTIDDNNNTNFIADVQVDGYFNGSRVYFASATDPVSPLPIDGDSYYNTVLGMDMKYDGGRAKWLSVESMTFQVGRNNNTPSGGFYRGINGLVLSGTSGYPALFAGTIIGLGYTRTDSDAATFEVTSSGATIASVVSTTTIGIDNTLDGDFAGVTALAVRNAAGGNTTSGVTAWVRIKWRA